MIYDIPPFPKPAGALRDRWGTNKRPVVARYHAWRDEFRLKVGHLEGDQIELIFHVPMPKSWSKKKRYEKDGTPHQQRPDVDNYVKAVLDALFEDDSHVWKISAEKRWASEGSIWLKVSTGTSTNGVI